MTSQSPSRQHMAAAEETQRRSQLVLQALPVLLIPALSAIVTALLVSLTLRTTIRPVAESSSPHPGVIGVIVIAVFLTALIVLVRLGRPTVSALVLIGVWTLITTLASLRGGVASIGPAFLVIPICAAGLLIDGIASLSLAAMATVLVGGLAWMQMLGLYAPSVPLLPLVSTPLPPRVLPLFTAGVWTGLFWTVALLTWLLAGGLQRALAQSREQALALRELSDQLEGRVAAQTAELARRASRAEALYEVSQALTSTLDLDQVLALIAEQAARLLSFDSAQVLLQQPDGGFASLGAYPAGQPVDVDGRLAALEPLLREMAAHHEPSVVPLPGPVPATGQPAAALMLPMHYRTGFAGVLMLSNPNGSVGCGSDDLILGQGLADQAAVAIANARLLSQAREAATLEERTRLARDIHDTLAQGLTGVVVQLGAAQRAMAVAPEESREHLVLAQRLARESLAEARRSVWNLRAPALERGDLGDALKALTVRPLGANVSVTFGQRGESWELSSAIESTLLRVCQEALINVAKHARATEAGVLLEYLPDSVRLSIRDNGIGFDQQSLDEIASTPGPWGGFGLVGMRERLGALGGTLELSHEGGAHILAAIPRPRETTLRPFAPEPVAAERDLRGVVP